MLRAALVSIAEQIQTATGEVVVPLAPRSRSADYIRVWLSSAPVSGDGDNIDSYGYRLQAEVEVTIHGRERERPAGTTQLSEMFAPLDRLDAVFAALAGFAPAGGPPVQNFQLRGVLPTEFTQDGESIRYALPAVYALEYITPAPSS